MDITQEELFKKYEELPEDLKTAMYSASTAEIIYEIGKKYGLNIEETGDLTTEVAKIILGINHPRNFISSLSEVLNIPKEKAIEIAQDINHQIFFPIREELKKLHGIKVSSELTPITPSELPQKKQATEETPAAKEIETLKATQPTAEETDDSKNKELPAEPILKEKSSIPTWVKPTEEKEEENSLDKYREPID